MAAHKLSPAHQAAVQRVDADTVVTAIVRTRHADADRVVVDAVRKILQGEHLATRRADLLRNASTGPELVKAFTGDLAGSVAAARALAAEAVPQATELWLAGAVAVRGTSADIADLARHQDVSSVDVNPLFRVPDVLRTPLEDAPSTVDGSTWGLAAIGAPQAWAVTRGEGVVVGHLDTGVDGSHPALEGKIAAYQELDELGLPVASATHDTGDHGTHTAGTIVGRTHNGTNIGVAPRASLASALVLPGGTGTFAQIVAGMQWTIDQGAHVLNLSLGSVGYSTMWNRPILSAALAGVLVVAAVGNSGAGTSGGPGNDPLALGVGATHHVGGAAGFSGGQALVEVAWLDEAVTYVKPDLCAPGVGVLSSVPADQLAPFNGTSMAAPHVAGVAALVHSAEPGLQLDPFTTRALLLGAGTDDLGEAGRDQRYGFGRLDARSAVAQATSLL